VSRIEVTEVAIIGAGAIGASAAYHLSARGARPLVIEADRPGRGATLNSFSWVNAVGKRPRHYFDFNQLGMVEYRRLATELDGHRWFHPGGNLEWEPPDADRLVSKVEELQAWGYAIEWVDRQGFAELAPAVAVTAERAAFFPDDAFVDSVPLVGQLLSAAGGTTVWQGSAVQRIEHQAEGAVGLELTDGRRVAADRVVLCPGPAAASAAGLAGFELPMRGSWGLIAVTEPAPLALDRVLHAPGVAIRPDGGGRLMLQAASLDALLVENGGDLDVTASGRELAKRAVEVLPGLAGTRIEVHRLGSRAITSDGLPAIGPLPEAGSTYLAVTHSGITLAPLIGRLVADELLGEPVGELSPYRPARFTKSTNLA
jgi:D-hydroxyproline dehydrogenase subunit beta